MSEFERDPLHEKLCAWILGETTPDEAREVEAALARSAELREERARLEATIGAVRGAFAAPESLSQDALSTLLSAAASGAGGQHRLRAVPPARPRSLSMALRAAAAVTALLGGVLGALHLAEPRRFDARPGDLEAARLDERPALESSEAEALAKRGYEPRAERQDGAFVPPSGEADAVRRVAGEAGAGAGGGPPAEAASAPAGEPEPQMVIADDRLALDLKDSLDAPEVGRAASSVQLAQADDESRKAGLPALRSDLGEVVVGAPVVLHAEGKTTSATTGGDTPVAGPPAALGEQYRFLEEPVAQELLRELGYVDADADAGAAGAMVTRGVPAGEMASETAGVKANRLVPGDPYGQASARSLRAGSIADGLDDFYLGKAREKPAAQPEEKLAALEGLGYSGDDGEDESGLLAIPRALDGLRQGRRLDEDELRRLSEELQRRCLDDCRRRPRETPRDMYFRYWGDNPFEDTVRDRLSTFSVDVDTASYVLARRYLREGHLPARAQVRTEEFVNYFAPDLAPPLEGTFALSTELAPSRFGGSGERWMLRVGIRGQEVAREERPPLALTFVVDVSGSMKEGQRLELVKHAIRLLVAQLDARDAIGIVAFSSEARLVLPLTSAGRRDLIESALQPLRPGGSTNAEAGLKMGYELARTGLDPAGHSRVVFLSDGVANTGQTDQDRITSDVARARAEGIYLNTIGVGMNNHNDILLEQLADKGDGICDYVDDEGSARRAIVERFTGALIPIASDVKVQVDFDPARVARYRLLGYENRAVADRDFRNDAVDAGEVGAGHQVVALYELELAPERDGAPLAVVHLRWKEPKAARQDPNEVAVSEIASEVHWRSAVASFAAASPGYRRAVLAAQLAEFLRRSSHAVEDSFVALFEEARSLVRSTGDPESQELLELVARAIELGLPAELQRDAVQSVLDECRRQQILEARLEEAERSQRVEDLREELRRRNDELERRLQEVLLEELRRRNR